MSAEAAAPPPVETENWSMHSYGAHFCEVRVNAVTGETRVSRFLGSFDCGRILNGKTAASQFRGGIIMGLGAALMEETLFDERTGRIMNPSLSDYHVRVPGPGQNVFSGAETGPAGLQAQQAEKPPVRADDRGPPPPGLVHALLQLRQAGVFGHGAARESSQRRRGGVGCLAGADVAPFHHRRQVAGRSDDQRRMDMIVIEKLTDLADGGAQWMPHRGREHRIGQGAHGLIHGPRLGNRTRLDHPLFQPPMADIGRVGCRKPGSLMPWPGSLTATARIH